MTSSAYEQAFANTRRTQARNNMRELTANDPLRTNYRLVYNAGIAKESYFKSTSAQTGGFNIGNQSGLNGRNGLWRILQTDSAGNSPAAVDTAEELWSRSQAYKGMITSSIHKEAEPEPSTDDKTAAKTNPLVPALRENGINYGFQFHYNPGSVQMEYGGPPPTDVTLLMSGREKFNSYGPMSGGGSIGISIILNRINDMKYFDPNTGKLKAGVSPNMFAGRAPDARELGDIYNRGTMYDMEFLFRTLLGYEVTSSLGRGMSWDKKTADVGWVGGKPIEVHLGKSLRYLARVVNISITHVLFTERMVPTFSEVNIQLQRIPDVGPDRPRNVIPAPAIPSKVWVPGAVGGALVDTAGLDPSLYDSDVKNGKLYGDLNFGSLFGN